MIGDLMSMPNSKESLVFPRKRETYMSDDKKPRHNLRDLIRLMQRAALKALDACRSQFRLSEKSHNETLYDTIAFIVALVRHLRGSKEECEAFIADPHWADKPHRPKEKNLPRLVAMYVLGAKKSEGGLYQQALTYTKVIEYYLKKEVPVEDIPADLQREKLYGLLARIDQAQEDPAASVEHRIGDRPTAEQDKLGRATPKRASPSQDDGRRDNDASEDDSSDTTDDSDDRDVGSPVGRSTLPADTDKGRNAGAQPRRQGRYPFKRKEELAVKSGTHHQKFFDMKLDDEVEATIKRTSDRDGWKQFSIVRVGFSD